MATAPLTKEEVNILIACVDRTIKADKITQARTTIPQIKEVYQQQQIVMEKIKQKLLGI